MSKIQSSTVWTRLVENRRHGYNHPPSETKQFQSPSGLSQEEYVKRIKLGFVLFLLYGAVSSTPFFRETFRQEVKEMPVLLTVGSQILFTLMVGVFYLVASQGLRHPVRGALFTLLPITVFALTHGQTYIDYVSAIAMVTVGPVLALFDPDNLLMIFVVVGLPGILLGKLLYGFYRR